MIVTWCHSGSIHSCIWLIWTSLQWQLISLFLLLVYKLQIRRSVKRQKLLYKVHINQKQTKVDPFISAQAAWLGSRVCFWLKAVLSAESTWILVSVSVSSSLLFLLQISRLCTRRTRVWALETFSAPPAFVILTTWCELGLCSQWQNNNPEESTAFLPDMNFK